MSRGGRTRGGATRIRKHTYLLMTTATLPSRGVPPSVLHALAELYGSLPDSLVPAAILNLTKPDLPGRKLVSELRRHRAKPWVGFGRIKAYIVIFDPPQEHGTRGGRVLLARGTYKRWDSHGYEVPLVA